jgi:predicted Zn-dependent protease
VPQYQRDLPTDDSAKIPFRFYAVVEERIRTEIYCTNGLVLVPVSVLNRLRNEDQLATVLAYGIAGELQQQAAEAHGFTLKDAAESAAYGSLGFAGPLPTVLGSAGGMVALHKIKHTEENERGRMALAFLSDAGFDPHQAPEAWRLLAPVRLPKDPAHLKYPERSLYLQNMLETQPNSGPSAGKSSN